MDHSDIIADHWTKLCRTCCHRYTHMINSTVLHVERVKCVYSFLWETILQLRIIVCHIGSHSVTCRLTRVNVLHINPSQAGQYSIYFPPRDGRLSWLWCWLYTEMVYFSADHPSSNNQGCREPHRGLRKTFLQGLFGEKIFEFCFLRWHILVYFIFLSDAGAYERHRAWGKLFPSLFSTGLVTIW